MKAATLLFALLCACGTNVDENAGMGDNAPEEETDGFGSSPAVPDASVEVTKAYYDENPYNCSDQCWQVYDCERSFGWTHQRAYDAHTQCWLECLHHGATEVGSADSEAASWYRSWNYANDQARGRQWDPYYYVQPTICDDAGYHRVYPNTFDSKLTAVHRRVDAAAGRTWYPGGECDQSCIEMREGDCPGFDYGACLSECSYWHFNPVSACEAQWVSMSACRRETKPECDADGRVSQPGCVNEYVRWASCVWSGGTSPAGEYPWPNPVIP